DPVRRRQNWGTYAVIDQKLWNRPNKPDQGIGGFVQVGGLTPNDRSLIERYAGVGLNFIGPFRNRPADVFGIAYNVAETSTAFHDFNQAAGTLALDREKVLEVGYRIQVNDWLTVKPNVQFIKNPGADSTRSESRVFGLRFTTIF
ncbi:MAG TPA: carbohydrate porin, partial [Candidatus Ozemobacteraceae bacterium]|nr:carbohydrate porin [Candidatus Ozemobacteraceae bacterium]